MSEENREDPISQEEYDALPVEEQQEYEQIDEISDKKKREYLDKAIDWSQKKWSEPVDPKNVTKSGKYLKKSYTDSDEYKNKQAKLAKRREMIQKTAKAVTGKKHFSDLDGQPYNARTDYKYSKEEIDLDEESLAAATLKPGSRSIDNPKSKIEAITSVIGAMHSMRKDDLTKWYTQAMALIGKEADSLPAGASADSNQSSIDMKTGSGPKTRDPMPKISVKEDVEEMFVGEELSEEFKDKASTLFEAAVNARVTLELSKLEEEFEQKLEEELSTVVESIENNLDSYLDYVVEKWMEDNQVAIESSLRNEIMEEFISGLKGLFAEHYIDVPEDKVDVLEALSAKVEELEESLSDLIEENSELKDVLFESKRQEVLQDFAEGLTMTQAEKFFALAEGIDFDGDLDVYAKKLSVVKENYFAKSAAKSNLEEETFEVDTAAPMQPVDPSVNRYVQAISRTVKK